MIDVKFLEVKQAAERIKNIAIYTPILRMVELDDLFNEAEIYVKPENLQQTGSFKIRGASNKILTLSKKQQEKGIITVSSGNHAQGVAYAAKLLGIQATVVMPENVLAVKKERTRLLGANVVSYGKTIIEARSKAQQMVNEKGYEFIPSFADQKVIAGQGTVGLEIVQDLPDVDMIILPVGGGGLVSGVALAAKSYNPKISVIGAEPALCPRFYQSRIAGSAIALDHACETVADGLRTMDAAPLNYHMIENYVDKLVAVEDHEIISAFRTIIFRSRLMFEISSAIVFAALLSGNISLKKGMRVCLVISGGNIDRNMLMKYI